jgi:hypothetical protein
MRLKTRLRRGDYWMLAAAGVLGIASAARSLGVAAVTPPAVALLGAAALLAIGPLVRFWRNGDGADAPWGAIVAVIIGCHLVGTLYFFPPEDLVNARPVLTLDHAVHFYEVQRGKDVFWSSFRLSMYDPYFLAGYPGGTVFEIDTTGASLWCALLRFVETARSYKLFILLAHVLAAATIYAGCRRLRFTSEESAFGTLLFLAYWQWGRPYAGDFRFAGMFAYLFVCHLSLYVVGLFRSFLDGERAWRFFIVGPLAFLVHPTAAVLLPVPFLALLLARERIRATVREGAPRRTILVWEFLGWCLLVVVVNALWLVPLFRYLGIKTASESFFQIDGMSGLLRILIRPGNFPALLLIALAGIGFGDLARRGTIVRAIAPAAGSAFLVFLAAFGVRLPIIDQMEPGRFLVPAFVFMAPLAGAGMAALLSIIRLVSMPSWIARSLRTSAAVVLILCVPAFGLVESRAYFRHTLSTTFTPEVELMIEAIKTHADRSGRLMIEDGPAWAYGDSHLPSIVPLYTGIEQIGGPYPFMFIEHGFTTFQTRETMGMPLAETPPERLLEYIELYNVRWIMTATREAAAYVDSLAYAALLWASTHFRLYGVTTPAAGFASDPAATVRATYDLLHVTLAPEEDREAPRTILLKYHWDPGLAVAAPSAISPVKRLDDPVPMILLEPNGISDIRITFR